jgi:hypothetical protein
MIRDNPLNSPIGSVPEISRFLLKQNPFSRHLSRSNTPS